MSVSPLHRAFPRQVLSPACGYPLVMRLGMLSEFLICLRRPSKIKSKPQACFRLLSMTGAKHLLLLRESLYSFCKVVNQLPELELLNDGSLDAEDIYDAISFWPSQVNIFTKDQVFSDLKDHASLPYLEQLSKANPLGLKLSFIVARSKFGPQLFVDSDILWQADPSHLLQRQLTDCNLAIGQEDALSINHNLATAFAPSIVSIPGPNSGCVWSQTDLARFDSFVPLLSAAVSDIDHVFNEQTILAVLASIHGRFLPDNLCVTFFGDRFKLFRRRLIGGNYCARHYVNILRHLFFLDVLMMTVRALLPMPRRKAIPS